MGLFDDAVPGGNISKPIMIALGALLVGKLLGAGGKSEPEQAQKRNSRTSKPIPAPTMAGCLAILAGSRAAWAVSAVWADCWASSLRQGRGRSPIPG